MGSPLRSRYVELCEYPALVRFGPSMSEQCSFHDVDFRACLRWLFPSGQALSFGLLSQTTIQPLLLSCLLPVLLAADGLSHDAQIVERIEKLTGNRGKQALVSVSDISLL